MKFFINAVKLIAACFARTIRGIKIHFCIAMTVDAPTHAQFGKLVNFIHIGNLAMTGLALHFARFYVL